MKALGTTAAVVGLAVCALPGGCRSSRQQTRDETMAMVRHTMEMQAALIAEAQRSVVGYGQVSIRPRPAGAKLLIDEAEILDDAEALAVPLGVHEFAAVWPDGATATRRIFVPQMEVTYDIDYEADMAGSGGKVRFSGKPEVKNRTVIVLEKPDRPG